MALPLITHRVNNPSLTDLDSIGELIETHRLVTLQYSAPLYSSEILARIDSLCRKHSEKLEVRFYGHYGDFFDCATLLEIPSVQNLLVDCLQTASNLGAIKTLKNLKTLSLGVDEMKDAEFLHAPNLKNLTELRLGETKHEKVDLRPLATFVDLKYLHLSGQSNHIECLGGMRKLETLSLGQTKKNVDLEFVNSIASLSFLRLILGGRSGISEVKHENLKRLEIIRVLGFEHFDPAAFPKLKELQIEDEIRFKNLTFAGNNENLESLWILNCKTFNSLTGLRHLKNLSHLRIARADLAFDPLIKEGLPSQLKIFGFYSKKASETKRIRKQLDAKGYKEFSRP
jgi:protein phosphatase 1 regulatory subunit 7